jgi:hypothetical protein
MPSCSARCRSRPIRSASATRTREVDGPRRGGCPTTSAGRAPLGRTSTTWAGIGMAGVV